MVYSCIHTHTELCDGQGTVEDYCRVAVERGFESIGFSAHSPIEKKIGFRTNANLPDADFPRYCALVAEAKEKWRGKLAVYLGLEVDYIKGYSGPADRDIQEAGLDFIIGSAHCVLPAGKPIDWGRSFAGDDGFPCVDSGPAVFDAMVKAGWDGDGEALARDYFDAEIDLCRSGGFDMLAHPDIVKVNNRGSRYFDEHSARYLGKAEDLAAALAKNGSVFEVNTGGMNRGRIAGTYPGPEILKIFHAYKLPVTINADAHKPEHLGGFYEEARRTLLAAGYREYYVFNGREAGKARWRAEAL